MTPISKLSNLAAKAIKPLDVSTLAAAKEPTRTLLPVNGGLLPKDAPKAKEPEKEPEIDFVKTGEFIDKFVEEHGIYFSYYATVERVTDKDGKTKLVFDPKGNVEKQVRAHSAKIADALRKEFPELEVHEHIESATHKPPFAVSRSYTRKKKGAK